MTASITTVIAASASALGFTAAAAIAIIRSPRNLAGLSIASACAITAVGSAVSAYGAFSLDPAPVVDRVLEALRWAAWYSVLLTLYRRTSPNSTALLRRFALCGALLLTIAAASVALGGDNEPLSHRAIIGMLLGVLMLLLTENLYRTASGGTRWHVNLVCIAIAGLYGFDTILYANALLYGRLSPVLLAGRFVVGASITPLLVVTLRREARWKPRIGMSRAVVFHSATLVISGGFLLALSAAGELMRQTGADWGELAAISLPCAGIIAVAVCVTSQTARSTLRRLVVDHFFAHRYDYRREWLRCIATLSQPDEIMRLDQRVIQAVTDTLDSPAGSLLLKDQDGDLLRWAGSLNRPPVLASLLMDDPLVALFRDGNWAVRTADCPAHSALAAEMKPFWLAVPLSHNGRFVGFVLAAPPRSPFKLDRDVYELLRIIGREVATMIIEARAIEALQQSRELHEFSKRFAFLAHDIRTVSSQLAMLLDNAKHHGGTADFQGTMMDTLRHCNGRMTKLLARLKHADAVVAVPPEDAVVADPIGQLRYVAAATAAAHGHQVVLDDTGPSPALGIGAHEFETIVTHLLKNAIEASSEGQPVILSARLKGPHLQIDIADAAGGMSPDYIRDHFFRPFASSKSAGMGIGGYQARELLRQAGGNLVVISQPGDGTTMRLLLPLQPESNLSKLANA